MQTLSNILKWILVSSADPERVSATIKLALLGLVPLIMQGLGLTCGFHLICPAVTSSDLANAALSASNAVFYALSLISEVGVVLAFLRKVFRTITGTNAAFSQNQ